MARATVPKFGDWASGGNEYPYTVCFDNARKGRSGSGKLQNPNDPQENPNFFLYGAPPIQTPQPKATRPLPPPQRDHEPPKSLGPQVRTTMQQDSRRGAAAAASHPPPNITNGSRSRPQSVVGAECGIISELPINNAKNSSSRVAASPSVEVMRGAANDRGGGGHATKAGTRSRGGGGVVLPKFGEWDVGNPAGGDGYTQVFNRVREEKRSTGMTPLHAHAELSQQKPTGGGNQAMGPCCFPWSRK